MKNIFALFILVVLMAVSALCVAAPTEPQEIDYGVAPIDDIGTHIADCQAVQADVVSADMPHNRCTFEASTSVNERNSVCKYLRTKAVNTTAEYRHRRTWTHVKWSSLPWQVSNAKTHI